MNNVMNNLLAWSCNELPSSMGMWWKDMLYISWPWGMGIQRLAFGNGFVVNGPLALMWDDLYDTNTQKISFLTFCGYVTMIT